MAPQTMNTNDYEASERSDRNHSHVRHRSFSPSAIDLNPANEEGSRARSAAPPTRQNHVDVGYPPNGWNLSLGAGPRGFLRHPSDAGAEDIFQCILVNGHVVGLLAEPKEGIDPVALVVTSPGAGGGPGPEDPEGGNGGGTYGGYNVYRKLAVSLPPRGITVLLLHYPFDSDMHPFGHGRGKAVPRTIDQMETLIRWYLDRVQQRHLQVVTIGWSMGGAVAIETAARMIHSKSANIKGVATIASQRGQIMGTSIPLIVDKASAKLLLMVGSADDCLSPACTEKLAKMAGIEPLIFPGENHGVESAFGVLDHSLPMLLGTWTCATGGIEHGCPYCADSRDCGFFCGRHSSSGRQPRQPPRSQSREPAVRQSASGRQSPEPERRQSPEPKMNRTSHDVSGNKVPRPTSQRTPTRRSQSLPKTPGRERTNDARARATTPPENKQPTTPPKQGQSGYVGIDGKENQARRKRTSTPPVRKATNSSLAKDQELVATWDPAHKSADVIGGGSVARVGELPGATWHAAFLHTNVRLHAGLHSARFDFHVDAIGDGLVEIGIATQNRAKKAALHWPGLRDTSAWTYASTGQRFWNIPGADEATWCQPYGVPYGEGDTITLQIQNGSLSFLHNDRPQGVLLQNLPSGGFYVGATLGAGSVLRLL